MAENDILVKELASYRLENKLSQEKLARTLGVSFATVNRWLKGHSRPNQIQTFQIKKLLKGGK